MNPGAITKNLQKLGNYRLSELLGFNGVFATYQGQDSEGKQAVVVAAMQERIKDAHPWEHFLKEVDPFHQGSPQKVCKPIAYGQDLGHFWASYEWLSGCHLGENVRNNGLPPMAESFEICADLVDALSELHKAGVLHRILNPASIFLSESGKLQILHAAWGRMILGTKGGLLNDAFSSILPFVSPEVLDRMEGDESSDVYSVGANLYFLLTGQPTFWHDNSEELARQIRKVPVNLNDLRQDLNGDAVDILEEMLAKDPEDRPVNFPALSNRLRVLSKAVLEEEEKSAEAALAASLASETPAAVSAPAAPEVQAAPDVEDYQTPDGFDSPDQQSSEQVAPAHAQSAGPVVPMGTQASSAAVPPPAPQVRVFEEEVETANQRRQRYVIMGVSGGVLILALMAWGALSAYNFLTAEPKETKTAVGITDLANNIQEQQLNAMRYSEIRSRLRTLGLMTAGYNNRFGRWPDSITDLDEMGGTSRMYVDPWDSEIDLRQSFLVSAGADGAWDNDDDVWYDVELSELGGHEPEIELPMENPLLWGQGQRLEDIIKQSTENQAAMQDMIDLQRRQIEGN